jgi:hypothetical protein
MGLTNENSSTLNDESQGKVDDEKHQIESWGGWLLQHVSARELMHSDLGMESGQTF